MSEKFKTGSLIAGSYRVLDFIGEGAMGLVYKVEHTLLNKILAFKVLKTEFLSEAIWKRFRLEGQAIARLDHVNIVKIYDMSQTEDGLPFFTMDLLVGQSLDDYLQDYGRLSVEDALPIFRQVCAGLAYANDHGIIHRDIKPGNIMLIDSKDGSIGKCTVKIVDFGIAKLVDDGNTSQQGLTRPGEVFGSPLYMSPEQCMGAKLDQRTDMYSVGITMFQALTGKPPLLGKSAVETAALHQSQEPPMLCDVAPDVEFPIELEEVIATMLAKSPDDRYSSLAEVANLLLQIEKGDDASHTQRQPLRQSIGENDIENDNDGQVQQITKRQVLLVVSLTVISLASAILLVRTFNSLTNHDKKPAQGMPITPTKDPKTVAIFTSTNPLSNDDPTIDEDKLSPQEIKDIEAFIANKKTPYSRIVKGTRVFDFSDKFSLGDLIYTSQAETLKIDARGTVSIPVESPIKLQSEMALQVYPELLTKFRKDDINELDISFVKPRNPKLAPSIAQLTGLRQLAIKSSELTSADLKDLEQLKILRMLNLSRTKVNSADLAKNSLIEQLKGIQIEFMDQPSVLLESLSKYNNISLLDLRHVDLQTKDFATISRMKNIITLTLTQTNIADEDLKLFSKLLKLRHLNIDKSSKLTENCIVILSQFADLRTLSLPDSLRNEQIEYRLKKRFPKLNFEKRNY
ncbi:serine/threonine protein kinase [bacterium]|nr:serine/threonine protein kinase [bacterium]